MRLSEFERKYLRRLLYREFDTLPNLFKKEALFKLDWHYRKKYNMTLTQLIQNNKLADEIECEFLFPLPVPEKEEPNLFKWNKNIRLIID